MKRFLFLCFACLVSLNSFSISESSSSFKKGDWFECEMEFEGEIPVFRNHWIPGDEFPEHSALVNIRFTYDGMDDDTAIWKYKVLRLKTIRSTFNLENSDLKNCYVFDSWYPDYKDEEVPELREKMTGEVRIGKTNIKTVRYRDRPIYFEQQPLFEFTRPKSDYSRLRDGNNKWSPAKFVDNVAKLIFSSKVNPIEGIVPWVILNTSKVDYLPNGLAYAFEDKNEQKVNCITQASFNLPYKATIVIVDERSTKTTGSDTKNKFFIYPNNPDFIPDFNSEYGPVFYTRTIDLEYEITCGQGITMEFNKEEYVDFYLAPGDDITVTLKDSGAVVSGSNNNDWWLSQKQELTEALIQTAPDDNEFRAYLRLKMEVDKRLVKMDSINTVDSLQMSMLPFVYLKSYRYGWSKAQVRFVHLKSRYFNTRSNKSGSNPNQKRSLEEEIQKECGEHRGFLLYWRITTSLGGSLMKYNNVLPEQSVFQKYFRQCGDIKSVERLKEGINHRKQLHVGELWPYPILIDTNKEKVKVLPDRKRYTLLCFYGWQNVAPEIRKMSQDLGENVDMIGINAISDYYEINLDALPYFKYHINEAWSWRKEYPILNSIRGKPVFVLLNHKGDIMHNTKYDFITGTYGINDNAVADHINKTIQEYEDRKRDALLRGLSIFALAFAISLVLTFSIYRIRLYTIKRRNSRQKIIQDLKLKSVQSQLNPHFLFNALNSIQALVGANKNTEANTYLVKFSELLRSVLKNSDNRLVSLNEELEMIDRYCELEKLRMDFTYKKDIHTNTPLTLIEVPFMLLQPLVENAIKHGVSKTDSGAWLSVSILETPPYLSIHIKNSGPGFSSTQIEKLLGKGKGLQLSLEKLYSVYNKDAELTLANFEGGGEVIVKIKMEKA